MNRMTDQLLAILFCAALPACAISTKPGFPVNHDLGPSSEWQAAAGSGVVDAPVWLWDERIRYRLLYDDPTVIRYYNLDRWEAPLPVLLEHRLAFAGKKPSIRLQVQLTQFEQQFETIDTAVVVLGLRAFAFTSEGYKLLGKQSFMRVQKSEPPNAAGAIAGFIALIEQAEAEIQIWLETLSDQQSQILHTHELTIGQRTDSKRIGDHQGMEFIDSNRN